MELSGHFKVKDIKKRSSATWFENLCVGDEFELRYNLNGRYKGAPTIAIYQKGKRVHSNTALQLKNNLEKFEIIPL